MLLWVVLREFLRHHPRATRIGLSALIVAGAGFDVEQVLARGVVINNSAQELRLLNYFDREGYHLHVATANYCHPRRLVNISGDPYQQLGRDVTIHDLSISRENGVVVTSSPSGAWTGCRFE